ncbi:hypothetical protein NMG60_11015710 [Bertholletia excelsa]
MISVLAQERLLGVALGSTLAAVVVFEQRRSIYKSIAESQSEFVSEALMRKAIFEKRPHLDLGHLWNKAVDETLGPLIKSLSSRQW